MLRPLKSARPLRLRQRHAGKRRTAIGTADCPFCNGGPDPFPRRGRKRRPAVFFISSDAVQISANPQMLCRPLRIHLPAAATPASSPAPRDSRRRISHAPHPKGTARRCPLNTAIPAGSLPCAASERSSSPATAEYRRTSRISHAPHPKGATRQRPLNTAGPAGSLMRRARKGRRAGGR